MGLYTDREHLYNAQRDLVTAATTEELAQAIAEAEAEVNGHVARRYTLPFTVSVPLLTALSTTIAIYKILTNRPYLPAERSVDSAWPDRYREAIAMLLRISEGEMVLVTEGGVVLDPSVSSADAWSSTMTYTPTFGEGPEGGFFVDRDKIQFEIDRRK